MYVALTIWNKHRHTYALRSLRILRKKNMHYENMPIQIYWKFYHRKMKISR